MEKKVKELEQLVPVKSTNIALIGFADNNTYVQFTNGGIYEYKNTGIEQFHTLAKAESVGKTFAKTLRNHSDYNKLEDIQLSKRKLSDEEMENEIINRLRHFSDNDMHKSSTGTQRMVAKRIIQYVKENV